MAETIYMIHGMCGGAWVWERYRAILKSRGYHCVAATLRYHDVDPRDEPPPELGSTGLLDYTQDLVDEIEGLGVEPILMGHSMGGLLAQKLCTRVPSKALVLVAPGAPAGILCLKPGAIKGSVSILTRWGWWRKPIRHTFAEAAHCMLHALPVADQHRTYARFVYESGRAAFQAGFWFLDRRHAARVEAARVTCPVLVVTGAEDRLVHKSSARQVAQRYAPRCSYHEFPDHAHWLVGEPGWEEVADDISEWLGQTLAA
jgi:pimeloyl-ACP methyl ester carboxylesterase